MTTLSVEQAIAGELPDGFDTTLVESQRLRQLQNAELSILSDTVEDYGSNTLTERDVIRSEVQRTLTAFQTPDTAEGGTLELPGTALEFTNIQKFAAYYKDDNDTPSGTIHDPKRAGTDDIVFSFATPEVYEEITGNSQDTFEISSVTGGSSVDVIGDAGLNEAGPGAGTSLSLDDDEMLYFTGDFIDISGGQSVLSSMQWADIDGEDYGPDPGVLQTRLSSTHILTGQGAWVKSTADLDMKGYTDGRAELVPIAFYMASGEKAPSLV